MPDTNWLPTPEAARHLGVHENTLKRRRDSHGGFLVSGRDYRYATDSARSRILWNVDSIQELLHKRSVTARQKASNECDLELLQRHQLQIRQDGMEPSPVVGGGHD